MVWGVSRVAEPLPKNCWFCGAIDDGLMRIGSSESLSAPSIFELR